MGDKSNNQGRGYEFACLLTLQSEISKVRPSIIEKNSSYEAAERAWLTLDSSSQDIYQQSAIAFVGTIFDLEPLILENDNDQLTLKLQSDDKGKEGDVRDVLVIRKGIKWEIGFSIKHNHFAVKHSRLSKSLDFGDKWYGIPCSQAYWNEVRPVFDSLETLKKSKTKWSELPAKENDVYIPILEAFKNELDRQNKVSGKSIPKLIVEYLLGKYDFYKIIGIDSRKITQIQSYNLRGTLNKNGKNLKRKQDLPISILPTRIVSLDFIPESKNTLELYLDNGWQFSFRIHNASTLVEPSLKFDIQIVGMPATIICIDCVWR